MHTHQLLDHPLFEEQPIRQVLGPFGFEISIQTVEPPIDPGVDDDLAVDGYASDPQAYIDSLTFHHPAGFTVVYRGEAEDGDIISVAVRAKTVFADSLLYADPAFHQGPELTKAAFDVISERFRQIDDEGWSAKHDDQWTKGQMADAAASYAGTAALSVIDGKNDTSSRSTSQWPWAKKWWKPTDPRRDLVKAGALILAEIERLDRAAERQGVEE